MTRTPKWLVPILVLVLGLHLMPLPQQAVVAQGTTGGGAWMDASPLPVWNQPGAPIPAAVPVQGNDDPRCRENERPPETPQEQALVNAGWRLFQHAQSGWGMRVVWGLAGYDGMCRPLGYQAFVFLNEQYTGTLSPQQMNSRTDGALQSVTLSAPIPGAAGRLSGTFSRYKAEDPLCCPSQTTFVQYRIQLGPQGPTVIAGQATGSQTAPPAPTPAPATEPGPDTFSPSFAGISFTFDLSLAPYVKWQAVPATPVPAQPQPALGGASPEHIRFSFVEGPDSPTPECGAPRAAQLCVYPVAGLRALDPSVAQGVDELQALLAARPSNPEAIPVFPLIPAHQTFRAQVRYLDFPSGSGVRFITRYAQDVSPVTNQSVFFTFQGLTSDGQHYVSLFWPVDTSSLPNTDEEALGGQSYEAWAQQYDAYLARTVQTLNGLPPDAFTPDLTLLDGMLETLTIDR
jgi:LppP/LprE lipoprotein